MIQTQNINLCPNIFSKNPIKVNSKHHINSFICSINKTLFGIYQFWDNSFRSYCFNELKGEIILFQRKEEQWTEYFRMEITSNRLIKFLCFTNSDTQLLFYQQWQNRIESLTINRNRIFGFYSYLSGTITTFFKFPSDLISVISSNDQKMLLIKCEAKYFLLDVNQKTVILTFEKQRHKKISFFDNTYLILIRVAAQSYNQEENEDENLEELIHQKEYKYFYNIMNQKIEKILYLCRDAYLKDFFRNDIIYKLQQKSLGCFFFRSQEMYAVMAFNLMNFKLIRKIILVENNNNHLQFLGVSQSCVLHSFLNNNKIYLHILKLFVLGVEIIDLNFEITDSNPEQPELQVFEPRQQIYFDNQVMMVKDMKRQQAQFWLANL